MRTITLSKQLTAHIHSMCISNIEHNGPTNTFGLEQGYEELRDMTRGNDRFKLTVTLEERIPQCSDIIVNILVKHILNIVDCNEDDTEEMNALYEYISSTYSRPGYIDDTCFPGDTIEQLECCVHWVIAQMGGDA